MSLTLIAEVMAGETWVTPGGCVDAVTACGLEPFLWERWHHDQAEIEAGAQAETQVELAGTPSAVSAVR